MINDLLIWPFFFCCYWPQWAKRKTRCKLDNRKPKTWHSINLWFYLIAPSHTSDNLLTIFFFLANCFKQSDWMYGLFFIRKFIYSKLGFQKKQTYTQRFERLLGNSDKIIENKNHLLDLRWRKKTHTHTICSGTTWDFTFSNYDCTTSSIGQIRCG